MARLLPKFPNSHFVIYMDNYFTSILLFSILRKENIGAARTTRPSGIGFPALLIVSRQKWSTKLDWGTTFADEVDSVLCIGWQDNNFVLGLSTVHTVHEASSYVMSKRSCPAATSTNASIKQKVFREFAYMLLEILTWVDPPVLSSQIASLWSPMWRDKMDVPSQCTIVKAMGRSAYRPKTTEESVIGIEVTVSAMLKTHKRKDCIPCP
jgi:hypothetical protein